MSRPGAEYRVARPTGVCAASGRELAPGSPCMATLCERAEDDGLDRFDYSLEAWEAGARPERLFSYWKTTVPDPGDRRPTFVDDDVLVDLFEQLAGDERRTRVAYRFILALILMRKRRMRYVGRRGRGEDERWLLVPRGPGRTPGEAGGAAEQPRGLNRGGRTPQRLTQQEDPIEVVNPRLTDADVRELTDQLAEVLQGDL